jgi:uncharacterized protein (TIGR03066 family)
MRVILGLALVALIGLMSVAGAQDAKIDGKKLIGKWSPDKAPKDTKATIEFTKDGKLNILMTKDGAEEKITGTYKLTGNKLSLSMKKGDMTKDVTVTITKLTDEELEGEDEKGEKETFKRVKEKAKKDKK